MSVSQRKQMANRENAKKSTGPRSVEGKQKARMNALKHGMTAEVAIMFDEDAAKIEAEKAAWIAELAPVGIVALRLAERAFNAHLRVSRCERAELTAIKRQVEDAEEQYLSGVEKRMLEVGATLAEDLHAHYRELKSNAMGCNWLKQKWEGQVQRLGRLNWTKADAEFLRHMHFVDPLFEYDIQPFLEDLQTFTTLSGQILSRGGQVNAPAAEIAKCLHSNDLDRFLLARERVVTTVAIFRKLAADRVAEFDALSHSLLPVQNERIIEARKMAMATDNPVALRARQYADRAEASLMRLVNATRAAAREEMMRDAELWEDEETEATPETPATPDVPATPPAAEPAAATPPGSSNEPTASPANPATKLDPTVPKPGNTPVASMNPDAKPSLPWAV